MAKMLGRVGRLEEVLQSRRTGTVLGSETQAEMSADIMNFNPQKLLRALAKCWSQP